MTSSLFSPASVAAVVLSSLLVSSAASPSISTPTSLRGNIIIDIPAFAVKDGYACKSTRTTRRRRHPPHLFIPLLSSGGRRPSLPSLSSLAADDIHDDSGIGRDVNHTPAESERRRLFLAAALLLDGAVFGLSTDAASAEEVGYLNVNDKIRSEAASAAYPTTVCVGSEEERRIAIFEKVAPSVVFIDTFTERKDAFSTNVMEVPIGSGSGFVWDDAGHIVTNFHVVQQAKCTYDRTDSIVHRPSDGTAFLGVVKITYAIADFCGPRRCGGGC